MNPQQSRAIRATIHKNSVMPSQPWEQPGSRQKKEVSSLVELAVPSLGANHEEFWWDQDPVRKADRALELIQEIRNGTTLGRILGNGPAIVGQVYGIERVPVVKGQAMPAYDPRAIKGTGVTYATSPQGADHTCGLTIRSKVRGTDPIGQAEISRAAQINMAGYDSLGACIMAGFGVAVDYSVVSELINSIYSFVVEDDFLQELGKVTLRLEREFNRRAGFSSQDDRLPEWMSLEPLPPHNTVFDVSAEDLDSVFDFLTADENSSSHRGAADE